MTLPSQTNKRLTALLLSTVFCTGCFGGGGATTSAPLTVRGAKDAVLLGDIDHPRPVVRRPSAPLGIYTAVFLSSGGFYVASGAVNAAIAQVKLTGRPSQDVIDTNFALLQEFDTVLQVDIADLLNRSQDRAETLDAYLEGLTNITERARQRMFDMDQYLETLQKTQKDQRSSVSTIDRAARDALKNQDYVLAGEKQQELGKVQADLGKTEADLKQQKQVRSSYDDLLELADRRIKAIEENREVLIAGLKVNNVPGADALGILEGGTTTRRSGSLGF